VLEGGERRNRSNTAPTGAKEKTMARNWEELRAEVAEELAAKRLELLERAANVNALSLELQRLERDDELEDLPSWNDCDFHRDLEEGRKLQELRISWPYIAEKEYW